MTTKRAPAAKPTKPEDIIRGFVETVGPAGLPQPDGSTLYRAGPEALMVAVPRAASPLARVLHLCNQLPLTTRATLAARVATGVSDDLYAELMRASGLQDSQPNPGADNGR